MYILRKTEEDFFPFFPLFSPKLRDTDCDIFFLRAGGRKANCLLLKQRCKNSSDGMFTRDPTTTDR